MFEKEAENYSNNWRINKKANLNFAELVELRAVIYKAHKDGAEFGYNKANEWHYVKDGDYPKEKGNYLVAWKRTHHVEEYGEWGFDVDLFYLLSCYSSVFNYNLETFF